MGEGATETVGEGWGLAVGERGTVGEGEVVGEGLGSSIGVAEGVAVKAGKSLLSAARTTKLRERL